MIFINWGQGGPWPAPEQGRGMLEKEVRKSQSQVVPTSPLVQSSLACFLAQPHWFYTLFISYMSPGLVTCTECPRWPVSMPLLMPPHTKIILFELFLFLMLVEGIPATRVSGSFVLLSLPGPYFCFEREFWHQAPSDMSGWKVNLSQEFCCFIWVIYEKLVFSANEGNGKLQNLKIIELLG